MEFLKVAFGKCPNSRKQCAEKNCCFREMPQFPEAMRRKELPLSGNAPLPGSKRRKELLLSEKAPFPGSKRRKELLLSGNAPLPGTQGTKRTAAFGKSPNSRKQGTKHSVAYGKSPYSRKQAPQNTIMRRLTFWEAERYCQTTFDNSGKWFHLYTNGKETSSFLLDDDDFRFCINLLARCAIVCQGMKIVAFAIMDNHIHIVVSGDKSIIEDFFKSYRRRLSVYLSAKYTHSLPNTFRMQLKEISDLKTLRNTIAYVHRNGYVVNPQYTPFSYPWSSGTGYFIFTQKSEVLSSYSIDTQRQILRGLIPPELKEAEIANGCITPASFCAIKLGMAMFRDAHHYFSLICKNVESYNEIATELDDGEYLTDQELFAEIIKILNDQYAGTKISTLSKAQKLDLAKTLHFKYRSSNGQIRRLLGITQYEVDQMFPIK